MLEIDKIMDEHFNINTIKEVSDTKNNKILFHEYEPTPYYFLDQIFNYLSFKQDDHIVDFGCGKGRVLIASLVYGCKQVTGYEVNPVLYKLALKNIQKFMENTEQVIGSCKIYNNDVQEIEIDDSMNIFFFFNPFHIKIYMKLMKKIKESLTRKNREVKILLFYPDEPTIKYFDKLTDFQIQYLSKIVSINREQKRDIVEFMILKNLS